MSTSAYTATIKHTGVDQTMQAIFIVGENPDDRYALGKVLDTPEYDWLGDYAYWELTPDQWFVARHGQNIGLDFMVQTDQPIAKLGIHPWQYATANKENN
jgi:hypothetical protein